MSGATVNVNGNPATYAPATGFNRACNLTSSAGESFSLVALLGAGVTNLLCLEAHPYATSPKNCYTHVSQGINPAEANKHRGHENNFHLYHHDSAIEGPLPWLGQVIKLAMPRVYALGATLAENEDPEATCLGTVLNKTSAVFQSFCSPTLRFHYTPEESKATFTFKENDKAKIHTTSYISHDRIGILGALYHGINGELFNRIKANPSQFTTGVIQLVSVVALPIIFILLGTVFHALQVLLISWFVIEAALFVGRIALPIIMGNSTTPSPIAGALNV